MSAAVVPELVAVPVLSHDEAPLHDPAVWKVQHLGRYVADGTPPPNHGQF
jgi:hypothetical protein